MTSVHDCIINFYPESEPKPQTTCGDEIVLHAITAAGNDRYEKSVPFVKLDSLEIPAGFYSTMCTPRPAYLPEGWRQCVNPEGALYYLNEKDALRVVTDVPLTNGDLCDKVDLCIQRIQAEIQTLGLHLTSDCEVYVHTDGSTNSCSYYLIDHDSRTEFWLKDYNSTSLGLPAVASAEHMRYALQEHYWMHVEYFPHRPMNRAREELVDILRQARSDQLTSDNSTFVVDADQCAKYIQLLDVNAGCSTTYMTWITARMWQGVARHRFQNYYGEDNARLSRDQKRLEPVPAQTSRIMDLYSLLMFGMPRNLKLQLETLFVDSTVYTMHWQRFSHAMRHDWRDTSLLSTGLLVADACFLAFSGSSAQKYTGLVSTMLSLASLSSSMTLLQRYSDAQEPSAAIVAEHLAELNHHALGFAPLAALYSLPRALACWAITLLTAHILLRAVDIAEFPAWASIVVIVAIVMLICAAFRRAVPVLGGQRGDDQAVLV